MPAGAVLDGLAEPTVSVYTDAERIMLERVARRLKLGLSGPSWAEEKLAETQALRAELASYLDQTTTEADTAVRDAIGRAYRIGKAEAATDLAAGGVAASAATNTYAVGAIVGELNGLLGSTHLGILRTTEDTYRNIIARVSAQTAAGTMTRREATQAALWKFADQGVTGFVGRDGRNWSLASYAEMATRTAVGHASIAGHLETLTANGHNLVIVSNAPGECEVCRPWEGKVLCIQADGKHPDVEAARLNGLFHPGCRHTTGAYFQGITEPMKATADPEGDADRQRLRYLERQTRAAKTREATALSPEAATLARARVNAYQGAIRKHVDETGLLRQRHREQITGTSRTNAGPKLPTAIKPPTIKPPTKPTVVKPTAGPVREFKDEAEGRAFIKEHFGGWHKDLTTAEEKGLSFYQSPGFELMNGQLRGTNPRAPKADLDRASKATKDLTAAIKKAPALRQNVAVYRGFSAQQFDLKMGATITDRGFVSMALSKQGVSAVAQHGTPAVARITLPTGTKVGAGYTRELILPPGASFKVTSVVTKGKTTFVEMTLVP